jgi:hypothetical protein
MSYKLILTSNDFFLTNSAIKHDNYASNNSLSSMNFKGMMREGRGGIEFPPRLHDQAPGYRGKSK